MSLTFLICALYDDDGYEHIILCMCIYMYLDI